MPPAPDWLTQSWYQELKSWQTGIAAFLGFIALVVGALINFSLNRRRDKALGREEAQAVAAALYGEITSVRERLSLLVKVLSNQANSSGINVADIDEQFISGYTTAAPTLYPALASKIGILPPDLALGITQFYYNVQTAKANLTLLVPGVPGRRYSVVAVLEPAMKAISDVRDVLRKIEARAKIPAAADPDCGSAELILMSYHAHQAERATLPPTAISGIRDLHPSR
jgi:hypothetical protein